MMGKQINKVTHYAHDDAQQAGDTHISTTAKPTACQKNHLQDRQENGKDEERNGSIPTDGNIDSQPCRQRRADTCTLYNQQQAEDQCADK